MIGSLFRQSNPNPFSFPQLLTFPSLPLREPLPKLDESIGNPYENGKYHEKGRRIHQSKAEIASTNRTFGECVSWSRGTSENWIEVTRPKANFSPIRILCLPMDICSLSFI